MHRPRERTRKKKLRTRRSPTMGDFTGGGRVVGPVRPSVYGFLAVIPAALLAIPDAESIRYVAMFAVWATTIVLWWRALKSKRQ